MYETSTLFAKYLPLEQHLSSPLNNSIMDIIATIVTTLGMLFALFSVIKVILDYRMKKHLIKTGLVGYEHIHQLLSRNTKAERISIIKYVIVFTMLGSGLITASFVGQQNAILAFGFILIWIALGLTAFLYFIREQQYSKHKSLTQQREERNREEQNRA